MKRKQAAVTITTSIEDIKTALMAGKRVTYIGDWTIYLNNKHEIVHEITQVPVQTDIEIYLKSILERGPVKIHNDIS